MYTRARHSARTSFVNVHFFSPEADTGLTRRILAFTAPQVLAAVEAVSRLFRFGRGEPSLIELTVRDRLAALGIPPVVADARVAGESWPALLHFAQQTKQAQACRPKLSVSDRCARVGGDGESHKLIVRGGSVFSFGSNRSGQLGRGHYNDRQRPRAITRALGGMRVVCACAGVAHSLVVTAAGALFSFGSGVAGRLGHGDMATCSRPQRVAALEGEWVVGVAAGAAHSLALTAAGRVFSFGRGENGRLGLGDVADRLLPRRVRMASADRRVVRVAAASRHSLAITTSGALFTWGRGRGGRHGASVADELRPKRLEALADIAVMDVALDDYTLVVRTRGDALVNVHGWGTRLLQLSVRRDPPATDATGATGALAPRSACDHNLICMGVSGYMYTPNTVSYTRAVFAGVTATGLVLTQCSGEAHSYPLCSMRGGVCGRGRGRGRRRDKGKERRVEKARGRAKSPHTRTPARLCAHTAPTTCTATLLPHALVATNYGDPRTWPDTPSKDAAGRVVSAADRVVSAAFCKSGQPGRPKKQLLMLTAQGSLLRVSLADSGPGEIGLAEIGLADSGPGEIHQIPFA